MRWLHTRTQVLLGLASIVAPPAAWANALIPAVNAYRNTSVFYFLFGGILLIEAGCFRLGLRRMHLASILWRVLLLNAASSLAGWLLMRSDLRPMFMDLWQQAIPFFLLTLVVELPLVFLLFRRMPATWQQKLMVGVVANILSYAFLIMAERPVEAIWLDRLQAADKQVLEQWTNTQVLAEAQGLVYGTWSGPNLPHRLRVLDPRQGAWRVLRNCPPLHPGFWDVEGDILAIAHYQEAGYDPGAITVRRLPDFAVVSEICATNALNSQSGWRLQISPDKTKLAVLVPRHEMRAPLRDPSYRIFGMTCDLLVFDITNGQEIARCPRPALRGLCWTPDSRRVLFNSLRDESLHDVTMLGADWKKKYPDADKQFADAPTYAYDVAAGTVEYFGEMEALFLAPQSGGLVYKGAADTLRNLDVATGKTADVRIDPLSARPDLAMAPDGQFAIVHITLSNPMAYMGYPVIVDLRDPARRYRLPDGFDYRFDWTARE